MEFRFVLDERDFKTLISGRVVVQFKDNVIVKIALEDIGYDTMMDAIQDAVTTKVDE